jgi:dTDP-4-amino-4,6-dideoxygalactose transaminase
MKSKLALFQGPKIRTTPFPPHPVTGQAEKDALLAVLDSGNLSTFVASPGECFFGGKKIKQFEREFAEFQGVKYAVAFNSATAALHAAMVACGVQPGEEVIVPPYTFTSTATCALMHNAIPVFADIQDDIFCLDPAAVARNISPLTRAIIPVHLFGHPAEMDGILRIARKHSLKVIEDCAQAPAALHKGRLVGTMGDCGVFSFTESKAITTGEGGMLITQDAAIADVARLVRNHGEVILEGQTGRTYRSTMLGWNYRMTEIEAALGIVQFRKLEEFNQIRIELCNYLTNELGEVDGLAAPTVHPGNRHVYYIYALKYDEAKIGIPRALFLQALEAEGIPFDSGYVRPLYLSPLYHDKKPFAFRHYKGNAHYDKGLCPVAERMHEREVILTQVARPPATLADMEDVVRAFHKILERKRELLEGSKAVAQQKAAS